jgi:hypothetical protein
VQTESKSGEVGRKNKIMYGTGVFALLGALLSSYLAPKIIAWWFDPPVDIGVNCRGAVEWSMAKLQVTQFWGLVIGLVLGLIVMIAVTRPKLRDP